jgi:endonuclease YncB( thermonuclease family)
MATRSGWGAEHPHCPDRQAGNEFRCAEEKALGDQATQRLQSLLNSGAVSLSSIDRDEDSYGRKLRNVAVDGRDVGETLIAESLARPYAGGRRSWCT